MARPSSGKLKDRYDSRLLRSTLLYRLESAAGSVARETSSTGRRRRCYRLTSGGEDFIRKEWAELFRALKRLTKVSHA
jgi:DNA-binding PadR family transcriptional regulator